MFFSAVIHACRNDHLPTLPGAREAILNELTKRMQRIFPEAEVRVKPMMTLPAINTDASKHEKELISRTVQEMFEEADMWLTEE